MKVLGKFLFMVMFTTSVLYSQDPPRLSQEDRVRLAEAFKLGESIQDRIWNWWSKAPFAVLLITEKHEFLVRHPKPSPDFDTLGYDSLLNSHVLFRKRQTARNLLATYPGVHGVSTIVVGQLKETGLPNSTAWIVTLLHEHFHQLQQSQPDYYSATEALNLSGGDNSGMWMLNYPFPYDSGSVNRAFEGMCRTLAAALQSPESRFQKALSSYLKARKEFQHSVSREDYRYYSLQLWQEGVARYTEYRVAQEAAQVHSPIIERKVLNDFIPYSSVEDSLRTTILANLPHLSLAKLRRVVFYTVGAAEAILLDRTNPEWHDRYFKNKFFLERYYGK